MVFIMALNQDITTCNKFMMIITAFLDLKWCIGGSYFYEYVKAGGID